MSVIKITEICLHFEKSAHSATAMTPKKPFVLLERHCCICVDTVQLKKPTCYDANTVIRP